MPAAVERIFGNFLDNAVKYLDPFRPDRVTVSGHAAGPGMRYEVADNGRGIASSDHARVFDPFRRAGPQDRPGEGIGLAQVRALGGRIELDSSLGVGTTFAVTLPRAPPGPTPGDAAAPARDAPAGIHGIDTAEGIR